MEAINQLPRVSEGDLDGLLVTVGDPAIPDQTKANCRCHFVARDANDRPRVNALARNLAKHAMAFCIPRTRIAEAAAYYDETGSPEKFSELESQARSLFTKLEKSGEGGELLLYLLLEAVLSTPQILCKMPLKTNAEMHVHGADGVHARPLPNGNLALYWGESKLYATPNSAIDACFKSVAPYLLDEGGTDATERDLMLVRENVDAGDPDVTAALVRYFEDEAAAAKVEFRGACLVGFSVDDYPHPFGEDGETIQEQVATAISEWHDRIASQIGEQKLEAFEFEVFCVPMPSVDDFRKALRERLGLSE
ncbi:MAG: DUF1837 domain-containing protein [Solirubrobacterales bacterium]